MAYPPTPAAGWQYAPPPYPAPPVPAGRLPADKSVGAALALSFFFGPLGLFYASIPGGLVTGCLAAFAVIVAVFTFGIGLVLLIVVWPMAMIWAAVSASRKHRNFEAWKVRALASGYPR